MGTVKTETFFDALINDVTAFTVVIFHCISGAGLRFTTTIKTTNIIYPEFGVKYFQTQ